VSDLDGSVEGTQGAAGTIEVTFSLTNVSPSVCVMSGYPGALLLGIDGSQLPTVARRGGTLSFENIPVSTVSIAAGESAWFNVGYSEVPVNPETSCPTSKALEITPPNDTQQLVVSVQIEACDGGLLNESPVFGPGNRATETTAPPSH